MASNTTMRLAAAVMAGGLLAAGGAAWGQSSTTSSLSQPTTTPAGGTRAKPPAVKKQNVSAKPTRAYNSANRKNFARSEPGYNSVGTRLGLRSELSEIALNSSAALVVDQASGHVLLAKNPDVALPIASITKVMTAIVTLEADLPLTEIITIAKEDTQLEKYHGSRLRVGMKFTRSELLHLALMSSENRAAHALGRTYPGGIDAFIDAMNAKADDLGMTHSKFVEPTGLSSSNQSTPRDLSRLVNAAYEFPLIREYSTAKEAIVRVGGRQQQFRNTNALTRNDNWEIGISKTGFIRDAGKCLVMQASIDDQDVIIVMLDAQGSASRLSDAERIRRWLSTERDRQATPARS